MGDASNDTHTHTAQERFARISFDNKLMLTPEMEFNWMVKHQSIFSSDTIKTHKSIIIGLYCVWMRRVCIGLYDYLVCAKMSKNDQIVFQYLTLDAMYTLDRVIIITYGCRSKFQRLQLNSKRQMTNDSNNNNNNSAYLSQSSLGQICVRIKSRCHKALSTNDDSTNCKPKIPRNQNI